MFENFEGHPAASEFEGEAFGCREQGAADALTPNLRPHGDIVNVENWLRSESGQAEQARDQPDRFRFQVREQHVGARMAEHALGQP